MRNKLFKLLSYILITFCWSCQNPEKEDSTIPAEKSMLSFDEFEEIAENQPQQYIANPDSFIRAINLQPKNDFENESYAYGLVFMAYNLREQGNIFHSIQFYEKALNFAKEKNVEDIDISLYILKPLAALYIHVDDNKKAITLIEDLLQTISPKEDAQHLGLINNLANAYIYNGESQKAIQLLANKINTLPPSLSKALLLNTLSTAYEMENDQESSSKYNQSAIAEFEKYQLQGDTLIWYASALTQYATLNKSQKEVEKALNILHQSFPHSQFRNKANAYLTLADIELNHNNLDSAHKYYKAAYQNFQQEKKKYVLDYKYTYALLGLGRTSHKENKIDSAIYYYEWAIENDFRTQQLITSERDQLRNNIWNKKILEELIQLYIENPEIQTQSNRETLLWCIELSKARLLINEINRSENWSSADQKIKDAIQEIRRLYVKYDATDAAQEKKSIADQIGKLKTEFQLAENYFENVNFNPSKSSFLEKFQSKKEAYYSYYIHQDRSMSIVYTKADQLAFQKIEDKNLVDSLIHFKSNYFSSSPNSFNSNPEKYYKEARYFYHHLLPELSSEKHNIFLSLDGELYGLPFDALYDKEYLIQSYNFAYLNSFLLFDFITNKAPTTSKEISLLYRSEFPKPLPHLAFVNQEVANLTARYKTLAISPEHQNDSTIREAFSATNIIHIAAHTILDSIEAPYLYLHQAISTNQLRFFEIKTPLVFLSACNTGNGVALPSEGTESIQRVFLSKNVPSVISTYWFANDEVMLQLTSGFYEELQNSESPMLALAQAKRKFLNQASILQQNPWFWANINYTGIGNEVGLKKSSNLLFILIGSVLLALIVYLTRKIYLGRIKN
ncbi:CHAT domain-containing protein [Sphingobacterium litopenaei]|uniref:CHAT domain-containing protein n=1 Tax=Sphingobacterium litopenaei TaxID=2763500 RepID=A0ABR7YD67_9SPHI|nr:CHAT domain-containing protein [Sphingobacterium litopenaei]MBD1429258.1 CHAT domain-containing protein [Sphingobacterium litopenaei]